MRSLSLIVASFIMFLMIAPFLGGLEKKPDCCKRVCVAVDQSEEDGNEESEDICNPFFCHSCCVKYTVSFSSPFQFEMQLGSMEIPSSVSIVSLYEADFWQPPKLSR